MNSSKKTKLALLTTIVILVICFIPAVQGKQPLPTIIRPIEDWIYAGNPFGAGPGFGDPDSMLIQRCLCFVTDPEVDYGGYIVETFRKDKSLLITIYISVWGMPMAIRDIMAIGSPEEWIFVGVMDFTYTATFILEKHIPGGDLLDWDFGDFVLDNKGVPRPLIVPFGHVRAGPRGPGADLPAWWILYYYQRVIGGHFVTLDFQSVGSGNYIQPGWNPPFQGGTGDPISTGEEGTVICHQQAFYSYDLDLNDPDVYQFTEWTTPDGVFKEGGILRQSPLLMPETWPSEYIILTPI